MCGHVFEWSKAEEGRALQHALHILHGDDDGARVHVEREMGGETETERDTATHIHRGIHSPRQFAGVR